MLGFEIKFDVELVNFNRLSNLINELLKLLKMLMNKSISAHNRNLILKLCLFYKYTLKNANYKIMTISA